MEILPDTTLFYDIVGLLNEKFQISDRTSHADHGLRFLHSRLTTRERESERNPQRWLTPEVMALSALFPPLTKKKTSEGHIPPHRPPDTQLSWTNPGYSPHTHSQTYQHKDSHCCPSKPRGALPWDWKG